MLISHRRDSVKSVRGVHSPVTAWAGKRTLIKNSVPLIEDRFLEFLNFPTSTRKAH